LRRVFHLGEEVSEGRPALPQEADPRPHVVVLDVRGEQAEGREVPRMARDEDARDPDLRGQRQRVHRPGAAVRDQDEVSRVVATLDGDLPDGGGHARHRDPDDPVGEGLGRQAAQPGGQRADRVPRPGRIESDRAAEPAARADPPEHDVGVGDGRLGAPEPVRCRARYRAGAPGTDLEAPVDVEPRDRAPAGADGAHVDLRDLDREGPDHAAGGHHRGEVPDQADVGRGPAHVVGDEVADPGELAHVAGLAHAPGRAREDRLDGQPARRGRRHHPAARPHGQDVVGVPGGGEPRLQAAEVPVHEGLEVGVEDRGREALELPVLGHDVRRAGDRQVRPPPLRQVGDGALVRGIQVGVEETDGEGLGAGGVGRREGALDAVRIERHHHGAVGAEPLGDLEAVPALDHGPGAHEGRHEEDGDVALGPPDLDEVPEPGGRHEGDPRAPSLQDRVGPDRRAVDETPDVAASNAERIQAVENGGRLVPRPRGNLGDEDPAGRPVDRGEVGEGSAHVDPDDDHGRDDSRLRGLLTARPRPPTVAASARGATRHPRRTDPMSTTTAEAIRHLWTHKTQDHPWLSDEELVVDRAEGVWVWTQQGKKLMDGFAGLAVVNVGHGRREIAEAIAEQVVRLAYYPTTRQFSNPPAAELAAKLATLTPGDLHYTLFAVSGSEANERSMQIARHYWLARGQTGKHKVISLEGGYHGATAGTFAVCGLPKMVAPYAPLTVPGFAKVAPPYPFRDRGAGTDAELVERRARELREAILREGPETVSAVILEPVLSAGGTIVPPLGWLRAVRAICDELDVLMIADEVITGFGRTGRWFACDHEGVVPDLLSVAKGITSGYVPLSASVARRRLADAFAETATEENVHPNTYAAHPVACAAALANIRIMEKDSLVENAETMGARLLAGLEEALAGRRVVGEVRGRGLLAGIELVQPDGSGRPLDGARVAQLDRLAWERGAIVYARGSVLRLAPPLCITSAEVDQLVDIVAASIARLEREETGGR
jgi:adenosylmethionine-8-amino-7-oxononanoate aminotransferase